MAVQLVRLHLPKFLQRSSQLTCVRHKWFDFKPDAIAKDPAEHATGLERQELMHRLAGNENPYYSYGFHPKKEFNEVPVPHNEGKRMIACICEEDSQGVNWMWLYRGDAQRCKCGYFFKLVDARPL